MLFQKNITLAFVAVCLTAVPSPSAALLKRKRVITDLTDSIIDERLFTDWRRDKQKMNRSGIDPDAIERDMEERRWLKSRSYSYSEDSNSKKSAADSSKGSVIDSDTKFSIVDSDSKSPETCKFKRKMYEPGQWIDLGTDKCKCDEKGSSKWVDCEKYKIDGEGEGELLSHTFDSNVGADEGVVKFDTVVSKSYALTSHTSDSKVAADEGGVKFDCKFKGKMYDPGQWIDLGTDKCKCDEGGSSKWIDCEQYKVGGEGEGAPPSHTSDSNVGADEGGVTVVSKKDADEVEIKTGVVSCPFAGVFTTNNIVVNFDYMVKTNPEETVNILATYTEIERIIFDSLASEIVDCSEESPKIIVAKSKGAERNLEVMLTDSYPEDQVVGTCDGVENCFIVRGAITVTYTENETEETATLYTMKTIKKKMDSGEFNNQGDIISVEYLGKPGNFSDMIPPGAREYDKNKSTKLPIILTCSFLFLALASFLAKILYDSKRNSAENSDSFMEENNDFFMEEPVDDKVPGMDDDSVV